MAMLGHRGHMAVIRESFIRVQPPVSVSYIVEFDLFHQRRDCSMMVRAKALESDARWR